MCSLCSFQTQFKTEEPSWYQLAVQDGNAAILDVDAQPASAEPSGSKSAQAAAPSVKQMRSATKAQTIAALRTIRDGCIDQANGLAMLIEVRSPLVALS